VHPQKTEVRFGDARGVYDAVQGTVARALRSASWQPGLAAPESVSAAAHYAQAVDRFLARAQTATVAEGPLALHFAPSEINDAAPAGYFSRLRFLGVLGQQFLVLEGPGGTLTVLDAHAASERLHAHRFFCAAGGETPLVPGLGGGTVRLPLAERERLVESAALLARLGIELEPFGADALAVRTLPPALLGADLPTLFVELASALPTASTAASGSALAEAIWLLACFAAGREARARSDEEVRRLLDALEGVPARPGARHGRLVVLEVPQLELLRRSGANLGPGGTTG
jgi:DNA mismatch repair protein MutL